MVEHDTIQLQTKNQASATRNPTRSWEKTEKEKEKISFAIITLIFPAEHFILKFCGINIPNPKYVSVPNGSFGILLYLFAIATTGFSKMKQT